MRTSLRARLALFGGWTVFVWGGRIRNVLADDAVHPPTRVLTVALSAVFVLGALAVLVLARRPPTATTRVLVGALGALTTLVWVVRGTDIALGGDHAVAFVVVHVVLAAVSIALAAIAWTATASVGDQRVRPHAAVG